ncbi:hypothetical protein GLOIN_2v1781259 [Rhizophagus clarus]|uniref:SAM domain-containing protein n=1 Tax=Rhizophagus clarus TaxID=94130 RepID=A0A8H3M110_9GLOM|nr:hypothetical protein GLOIN_2v1781259 [Rhizophagus clarus]
MAEISTCKYLLGTCYTCQKCLYCFKTPQKNLCKCKKSKQPARVNNPKRGQQIYQRVFTPNQPIPTANEFLFTANTKFSYNSNFNDSFSYTFCTACNSKFQRLGDKDKGKKPTRKTKMVVLDVENDTFSEDKDNSSAIEDNNVKENNNIESDNSVKGNNNMEGDVGIEKDSEEYNSQEDNSEEEDSEKDSEEDNVDEVKFKRFWEKKIKSTNYTTSYKAMNAHGPSNELEDELDFQEFLDEYKKVISVGKKMSMIIDMKNNITENKKSSKKHKKSSDESNSSSVEEEIELRSKKKKKSRAIREADLSKEEKKRSEVITALYEKYKCNIHTTSCYIQDHRHLQLNPARLQLWAWEIINKGTTYEIPPSFSTFDIVKSGVSVNKNNLTTQVQEHQDQSTAALYTSYNNSNTPLSPNTKLPTIGEFLSSLDLKYNCNNVYANFEEAFLEEAITVNAIKDLSDEQLQKLGVVKIGWQKNIKQAAQRF